MICVDANVLLEVILKRTHAEACAQFLSSNGDKAISVLTLDLVMYFVEKDKLPLEPVRKFLDSFSWLPIVDADAHWAFTNFKDNDFEDALQIACAIREGCSRFATLDRQLSKKYLKIIATDLIR